ncbi:MAG TPA: S1C family serine protease [Terriglobales bacterium]|nr:S1C family serine protease [Terriglobales bacterium]
MSIELQCKEGNSSVASTGTGFVAAYSDSRLPKGSYFDYLVTNRHVAECWDAHKHPRDIQSVIFRINAKDGSARRFSANPSEWRVPVDDSVDLAVMPIDPSDDLEFTVIPVDTFTTRDYLSSNQIAEGSPIILSGYFYQFPGARRFQSIVRQGILSMVPDEPMITTTGKPGSLYLGDVHIFGGNSGSPVMVAADSLALEGYRLLGVVSGYYYEDANFNLEIATTVEGTMHANSGVAMIVPADFLKALLDAPDLKGKREAYLSRYTNTAKP